MNITLSTDYLDALISLPANALKRAMQTVMSIKNNYAAAGLRTHKIEHPCGHIVSYSVNMDIRIIAYQKDENVTLLYIDHHENAYNWLNNRNFITGPNNDFRIIEAKKEFIPEVTHIIQDNGISKKQKAAFEDDIITKICEFTNDEDLFNFICSQPDYLQDQLYDLALTLFCKNDCIVSKSFDVKVVNDDEILRNALLFPLERWRVFLHPKQEEIVNKPIDQNTFITGSPGTGKTVCLVHKAKIFGDKMQSNECIHIHGLFTRLFAIYA